MGGGGYWHLGALLILVSAVRLQAEPWARTPSERQLSLLGSSSPIEPSGAHHPGRVLVGVGAAAITTHQADDEQINALGLGQNTRKSAVSLTYGLIYPIDVGVTWARLDSQTQQQQHPQQWAGYVQWSVFERFGLPAVALRAQGSEFFDLPGGRLGSYGLTAQASWGYRWLTIFAGSGLWRHAWQQQEASMEEVTSTQKSFWSSQTYGGAHLQIVPASWAVAAEVASSGAGQTGRAKVTFEF